MNNLEVGQYIKQRIKEKGITQDELAEMMNVTGSAVSQVLSGKNMFDVTNLQVLSRILDEPIDKILNAGEDPATALELLAMKSAENYKKEDPKLEKSKDKDHKGKNLFEYIIKHKNIELIRLYNQRIISELSNDIRLETILIQNEEVILLEELYRDFHFRRKIGLPPDITDFSPRGSDRLLKKHLKDDKELTDEEIDYLKTLTRTTNEKIFEITGVLNINQNNPNYFSKVVEYAIQFDEVNILELDHERRLKKSSHLNGEQHAIEVKFSKWLKKSIQCKSSKCIKYCYSMLTTFDLKNYFTDLIETKDKAFIQDFIEKYKSKSANHLNSSDCENGKFNNLESLKQLIEFNNIEILEYAIEFSTQQALDEALFITKDNQIEITKLLVAKGARFMVQDTYSSSNKLVLEPLSSMVKYLFDELSKKSK